MLKIRLKRVGRKGEAAYRVVVAQSQRSRNSKAIAELGHYNPHTEPSTFEIDTEAVKYWLQSGAQPTDTVAQFLVKAGLIKGLKRGSKLAKPKAKKKQEAAAE